MFHAIFFFFEGGAKLVDLDNVREISFFCGRAVLDGFPTGLVFFPW